MGRKTKLGEFEQLVLLAVLRSGQQGSAPEVARVLEEQAGREVSRGTLYAALDRLEERGYLRWQVGRASGGVPGPVARTFEVTDEGLSALAEVRRVLLGLWDGLEDRLGEALP